MDCFRLCNAIKRRKSVINILEEGIEDQEDDSQEGSQYEYGLAMKTVSGQLQKNILYPEDVIGSKSLNNDPICIAIHDRDIDALKLEAEINPSSVNQINCLGNTPLHVAVSDGWREGIDELLKCGASPNTLSDPMDGNLKNGPSSRHASLASLGDITKTQHYILNLRRNSKKSEKESLIESPFHKAVRMSDIDIVLTLMKFKPDLRILDGNGASVITIAAETKNLQLLKLLLDENECKNLLYTIDNFGNNILHAALTSKDNVSETQVLETVKFVLVMETVTLLLGTGIDINLQNKSGETPLYCAAKSGYPSVIELLLKYSSDPSVVTHTGRNVLHAACQSGSADSLSNLISTGKLSNSVTSEDDDGCSPFHLAIKSGSIKCCQVLLQNGDHLTNEDRDGNTRCSLILNHLTSAKELLQTIFDSHIQISDKTRYNQDFYVEYDYSAIAKNNPHNIQSTVMPDLINSKQECFLRHPLLETFLNVKWQRIKFCFLIKAIAFFLYLILHTVYLTFTFGPSPKQWYNDITSLYFIQGLHIFMFIIILVPDIVYFSFNARTYLQQWETYTKFIAIGSASYVVFSPHITSEKPMQPFVKHFAAISALMSWVEFMMLMGRFPLKRFPSYGIYIMMLTQVAKSFIKFIFAFLSLLIGFSVSFYIIFPEITAFNTFPRSFVKTLMMMIDGIDYWALIETITDEPQSINLPRSRFGHRQVIEFPGNEKIILENSRVSRLFTESVQIIFLLTYAFLISILMANLLIGLAINDIDDLNRQGKIRRIAKQATFQMSYEYVVKNLIELPFLPKYFKNVFIKQSFIILQKKIYPNKFKRKIQNEQQSEIIQDSIDLKSDEMDDDNIEDLTKMFTKFRIKYRKDQKNIQEYLKNISEELLNLRKTCDQFNELKMVCKEDKEK